MYVSKRVQKKLKEEACIKKYQEKLIKWAFKGWVVYHLREKAAVMKQSLSTQHWAIVLQWKTLLVTKKSQRKLIFRWRGNSITERENSSVTVNWKLKNCTEKG